MNLGEKISTIRKEKGLSQEAFGNELKVTRQTVSKWELDQAYPEVDKLIEISKKYDVSIEWLLGTRENRHDSNDLNEQQLQAIEDIVKKYMDNKPKEETHKYLSFKTVLLVLALCLTVSWISGLSKSIKELELRQDAYEYQNRYHLDLLNNKISNITGNIENILAAQNNLFINASVKLQDYEYDTNQAHLIIEVTPREYKKGMKIQIIIDNGKDKKVVDLKEKEGKVFTTDTIVNIEDTMEINAFIKINDVEKSSTLKKFQNVFLNTKYIGHADFTEVYSGNLRYYGGMHHNYADHYIPCKAEYIELYMFVNDQYIRKQRITPKESEDECYEYEYDLPIYNIINQDSLKDEKELFFTYVNVVHDEFGREYVLNVVECGYNKRTDEIYTKMVDHPMFENFNWKQYE